MRAMVLERQGAPLRERDVSRPNPGSGQVLVRVRACAVCRTDLHVVDGDLPDPKLPLIPGHEIAGVVEATGTDAKRFEPGQRVGIPWLGWTCGSCAYCSAGNENLCDVARFNGYTLDGGYAEFMVADERFCFPLPDSFSDENAAPLLCAGLIGYRSLRKTGEARRLGLFGFGASAHIVAQVTAYQKREVYAFTRPGDTEGQEFARSLGAVWAGDSETAPPEQLDAAIIFAPVGKLVPLALRSVRKGAVVVCAGIHMSDIPSFAYKLIWEERRLCSVANLTRRDGEEFMPLAAKVPVKTSVTTFRLSAANEALETLRAGKLSGAAVLIP